MDLSTSEMAARDVGPPVSDEPVHSVFPSQSPLRTVQKALIGLEGFVSVCGLGGGLYMMSHPVTTMPLHYLQGTWFHTWRWPGLALFFFVGLCPALVVIATIQRRKVATLGHLCVGAGLAAWVLLEAMWIVVSPGLQIVFGSMGVFILVLGVREWLFVGQDRWRG
jgi:hypothetical protein